MKVFTISRLNTAQGTFKVTGLFKPKNSSTFTIEITYLKMMGTDGWVLLDQKDIAVINLMDSLHSSINNYLQAHDPIKFS